jgi:hypothetical protein
VQELALAQRAREVEPVGLFDGPVSQFGRNGETDSNLELQHNVWHPGNVDVGVSLGVGLGARCFVLEAGRTRSDTEPDSSQTRADGAGYSLLTDQAGTTDGSPYASASLKLSPFYRERVHFGVGARTVSGEFLPFVAIGVGRR